MGLTLIHTADWQLGKQFGNVPGDAGAALRDQRVETVKEIVRRTAGLPFSKNPQ